MWLARCAEASTPHSPGTTSPDFSSSLARFVFLFLCLILLYRRLQLSLFDTNFLFLCFNSCFVYTGLWIFPISGSDQSRLPRHYQSRSSCHQKCHIKSDRRAILNSVIISMVVSLVDGKYGNFVAAFFFYCKQCLTIVI